MIFKNLLLFTFFLLIVELLKAQNINGFEIYVSKNTWTSMEFHSEITNHYFLEQNVPYKTTTLDSKTITLNTDESVDTPYHLILEEGGRKHSFTVVYKDHINISQEDWDFSDLKQLDKEIRNFKPSNSTLQNSLVANQIQTDSNTITNQPAIFNNPKIDTNRQVLPNTADNTKNTDSNLQSGNNESIAKSATTETNAVTTNGSTYLDDINDVSFKDFEKKALQKTNELSQYIKILCDKNSDYETSNKAIDQACALFVNEDAIVELSSLNRNTVAHYKIRDYLTRVKLIKYDKVEIEWTNIQYVSDLKEGPDGNYYGVVSFEQTFKGYKDGNLAYSDATRKNIEVVLKTYKKSIEGKTKSTWDILLSDIGVISTKNI